MFSIQVLLEYSIFSTSRILDITKSLLVDISIPETRQGSQTREINIADSHVVHNILKAEPILCRCTPSRPNIAFQRELTLSIPRNAEITRNLPRENEASMRVYILLEYYK